MRKKVIKQDVSISDVNPKTMCCWFCFHFRKSHYTRTEQCASFANAIPFECCVFIFIYFEISTNHCSPWHDTHVQCTYVARFTLSTSRISSAQRHSQATARHKLKHQPIHYQGSSCDNHKVDVVCTQFGTVYRATSYMRMNFYRYKFEWHLFG